MSDANAARLALAHHHVRRGREIGAEQRALIERIRNAGQSFFQEESLLRTFEDTLVIFEEDVDSLLVRAAICRASERLD